MLHKTKRRPARGRDAAGSDRSTKRQITPTNIISIEKRKPVARVPDRLAALSAQIRKAHEDTIGALRRGLEHAFVAGELLIEAKAQLAHGAWLPWLEAQCNIPDRTARMYMQLARNREALEAKMATVADLGLREALAAIAQREATLATVDKSRNVEALNLEIVQPPATTAHLQIKTTQLPAPATSGHVQITETIGPPDAERDDQSEAEPYNLTRGRIPDCVSGQMPTEIVALCLIHLAANHDGADLNGVVRMLHEEWGSDTTNKLRVLGQWWIENMGESAP